MKRRPTPKKRTRKPARKSVAAESPLTPYDANAAAIDVGATSHWVAVPPEGRAESVREFGVFTADLYRIAEAHKLAKLSYVLVKEQQEYEPESMVNDEAQQPARAVQKLTKQAAMLGYELRAVAS